MSPAVSRSDPPVYAITLWPHRSLSPRGFRVLMGLAALGMAVPVAAFAGAAAAWVLIPHILLALGLLWWLMRRNYRDGELREELRLWPDLIAVDRHEPSGEVRSWRANPFWVRLKLDPDGRPENYLTLQGDGRVIELGAFLSPEERAELAGELEEALRRALSTPAPDTGR